MYIYIHICLCLLDSDPRALGLRISGRALANMLDAGGDDLRFAQLRVSMICLK